MSERKFNRRDFLKVTAASLSVLTGTQLIRKA